MLRSASGVLGFISCELSYIIQDFEDIGKRKNVDDRMDWLEKIVVDKGFQACYNESASRESCFA
jgi:hypothetical protein